MSPPRFTEALLAALGARPSFQESLLGDLAETFASRVERDGLVAAHGWYRREALRAVPHLVRDGIAQLSGAALLRLALAVGASLLMVATLAVSANLIAFGSLGHGAAAPPSWPDVAWTCGVLVAGAGGAVVGGYVAARCYGRAPVVGATALAVVWALLSISALMLARQAVPVVFQYGAPLVVVLGSIGGGVVRVAMQSASQAE
jgi:hypothetical protein